MHCIKFISILLLLILNSCSNDKKISENYIENKDLETEMIKAYNEGMSALEKGDAFYIIESGTIDVFITEQGDEPVARLTSGQFFGEKALMSEDVRQATCIASSDAKCLTLTREDFVRMLGNLQDLLNGVGQRPSTAKCTDEVEPTEESNVTTYELDDLDIRRTLGIGAFGRVKLVKVKPDRVPSNADPNQTYALKCLSKKGVVNNGLQEHVVNEKN